MAVERVKQLLAVQIPQMGFSDLALLNAGSLLLRGINLVRRYRIYRNPDHYVALGVGHAIQSVAGRNPMIQDIARYLFLVLSIVKCAEDLEKMKESLRELKGHIKGTTPLFMRKDPSFQKTSWSLLGVRADINILWYSRVGTERIKRSLILIGLLVKQLGILALHLGDVKAAYTEDHVSAVIVHGNDLWKKLSDNESIIVKKLTKMEHQSDRMLAILNSSFTTKLFLQIVTIPLKVQRALPEKISLKEEVVRTVTNLGGIVSFFWEEIRMVDPTLRKYQFGPDVLEPGANKFVDAPIRNMAI